MGVIFLRVLVLVGLATGMAGCTVAERAGRPEPWMGYDDTTKKIRTERRDSDWRAPPANSTDPSDLMVAYQKATDDATKREIRDRYILSSLLLIDAEYDRFVLKHGSVRKFGDTAVTTAAIGLAGSAAVISSEVTKNILAITSATLVGANAAISKNYFYDKALPILLEQMEADRKEALLRLGENHIKPLSEYSITDAQGDLRNLYEAGTFEHAFSSLSAAASKNKQEAEAATDAYTRTDDLLSINKWLASGTEQEQTKKLETLAGAINGLEGEDVINAGVIVNPNTSSDGSRERAKVFSWLFQADDEENEKLRKKLGVEPVSSAEVAAAEAASKIAVGKAVNRRSKLRDELLELAAKGDVPRARERFAELVLAANREELKPGATDPIATLEFALNRNHYLTGAAAVVPVGLKHGDDMQPVLDWAKRASGKDLAEAVKHLVVVEY